MAANEKEKALKLTLDKLDKAYGKGAVMRLGDSKVVDVETISTGSITLDAALGIGGLPTGRVVEIYGPESSGKTTLTLHAIAEAQKKGGIAAFIDAEHAFDKTYAKKLGVNVDELLIAQPDDGEQALDIAEHLIRSGAIDICVIDSVAALVPRSELEGDMGDSKMGLQARVKVVKNKMAPPFRKAEFDIMYGEGISKLGEIIDLGVDLDILNKSGSWYSYGDTKLGQGRESVKELLRDNPELAEEVEAKIRGMIVDSEILQDTPTAEEEN